MGKVIILSGVPGGGKSTIARKYQEYSCAVICSADHRFENELGEYHFIPAEIGLAHQDCFRAFMSALMDKNELIIVDNTNLHASEISPYYLAAESYGYEVEIVRVVCDPKVAFERQQHGVPGRTFDKMVHQFNQRDILPWWNVKEYKGD